MKKKLAGFFRNRISLTKVDFLFKQVFTKNNVINLVAFAVLNTGDVLAIRLVVTIFRVCQPKSKENEPSLASPV